VVWGRWGSAETPNWVMKKKKSLKRTCSIKDKLSFYCQGEFLKGTEGGVIPKEKLRKEN